MLLLFVLCVAIGSTVVHGNQEVACTYKASNGDFYDFSPLSDCALKGYSVTDDSGFQINICNVVNSTCKSGSSVCQKNGSWSTGVVTAAKFSDSTNSEGSGATLTYSGGDTSTCPNNVARATVINLICQESVFPDPMIEFLGENPTCTYNFAIRTKYACPVKPAPQTNWCRINVFLVPHTHDDVGWQVTVDEYYDGEVRSILNTVTESLAANPARKFVYVEQAYFTRWWYDGNVTDAQRASLMKSYKNGQLEFVIGGWTMQDDACTTFGADIEQMTLGHQFLYNTFGARPSKGWQLDPFGSGSVTPMLEKLAGFDAHLIDRISEKNYLAETQNLQFLWQGVPSLGQEGQIFTEIMDGNPNAYCDFYFTLNFDNNPVTSQNVATYANNFYQMIRDRVPHFKTNNILAAWGCDFAFQMATNNFASMDLLMSYLAQNAEFSNIYVQYATVSEYFAAVQQASSTVQWPVNTGDDFFTYNDGGVWSGYFSSRTLLKGLVRQGEAAAHASEQIYSLGRLLAKVDTKTAYAQLYTLRDANGDATHHDGVTGTSTDPVVAMYKNDLASGMKSAFTAAGNVLSQLITGSQSVTLDNTLQALMNLQPGKTVAVVLYNSLGWARQEFVSLPVNLQKFTVADSKGNNVAVQVSQALLANAQAKYNLFFEAQVPGLAYATYFVTAATSQQNHMPAHQVVNNQEGDSVISNQYVQVVVSSTTGRISSLSNLKSNVYIKLDQELRQYASQDPSGAYVFKPAGPATSVSGGTPPKTVVSQGPLVTEVFQVYPTTGGNYASQYMRIYNSANPDAASYVEIIPQVGVLPDHVEVISLYSTNISNGATFYSDDNGFDYVERTNTYPDYAIEFQHYPTIYSAFIKDDNKDVQFTVVSDRSHSCSSLASGQFEIMLHRNPVSQDNKGLGGLYTDLDVVYPTMRVILDTVQGSKLQAARQPYLLNFPLVPFSATGLNSQYKNNFQFITANLPPNVHMQSANALEFNSTRIVMRLTHLFAVGEHPVYSQPATINVGSLFAGVTINKFEETSLTANNVLTPNASTTVVLNPKEIKTYIAYFA